MKVETYYVELKHAIKANFGCDSIRIDSVPVKEVFRGETAWEGFVEVFTLIDHPKARRCYCWGFLDEKDRWEITTVLEVPPVDSPEMAVKASIVAHARKASPPPSGKS